MGELPPRARRIPDWGREPDLCKGTTSACAENTTYHKTNRLGARNYLRVRGEYLKMWGDHLIDAELPPRARRIRPQTPPVKKQIGTTSACAENTYHRWYSQRFIRNYLRVRGEYSNRPSPTLTCMELPPRARRIPWPVSTWRGRRGTTSACAENREHGINPGKP